MKLQTASATLLPEQRWGEANAEFMLLYNIKSNDQDWLLAPYLSSNDSAAVNNMPSLE